MPKKFNVSVKFNVLDIHFYRLALLFVQLILCTSCSLVELNATQDQSILNLNNPFVTSINGIGDSFKDTNQIIEQAQLSKQYRYLRIWLSDSPALIVLGFIEPDKTLIWYSKDKNVFKTKSDRYVGSVGMAKRWDHVKFNDIPSWQELALASQKKPLVSSKKANVAPIPLASYTRIRSVNSNQETNIQERVGIYPIHTPSEKGSFDFLNLKLNSAEKFDALPSTLPSAAIKILQNKQLLWFTEVIESSTSKFTTSIRAYYALEVAQDGSVHFVFGHQCLGKEDCVSWMPWGS